jgi:preprotein translocase subunit SecD
MVYFAKWKIILTLAVLLAGILFAAPNLLTQEQAERLPAWVPHNQISLGLDLQGGSHLLFEVDVNAVIRDYLTSARDSLREALRRANVKYTGLAIQASGDSNAVVAKLLDPAAADTVRPLLREIAGDMTHDIDSAGNIRLELPKPVLTQRMQHAVDQSIEIVRRRIDETGVKEPTIQRQGDDRIIVQLPGLKDPERLKEIIGKTAKMTFRFVDDTVPVAQAQAGQLPPTDEILPSQERAGQQGASFEVVEKRVMVSGENLVDAQASRDGTTGQPIVNFKFDSLGGRKFADATRENVGRRFAIVLDGKVISAPVIREPILGGQGQISGNFTTESATDLALLLRAGALPAPLTVLEERTVGAELGADSIAAGKLASIMGLVLIVVALLVTYGLFGIFANIALLFNFILLIAAMSILQATLTLPGIAGMVLSLGMAVDANVLIHERIREEIRGGRGPVTAIDAGYRTASGTIMDSNLTVIISSLFLYLFGSGTVKGFAITLILGTIISMFTAVVVARMCTVFWLRRTRPQVLPI